MTERLLQLQRFKERIADMPASVKCPLKGLPEGKSISQIVYIINIKDVDVLTPLMLEQISSYHRGIRVASFALVSRHQQFFPSTALHKFELKRQVDFIAT